MDIKINKGDTLRIVGLNVETVTFYDSDGNQIDKVSSSEQNS